MLILTFSVGRESVLPPARHVQYQTHLSRLAPVMRAARSKVSASFAPLLVEVDQLPLNCFFDSFDDFSSGSDFFI